MTDARARVNRALAEYKAEYNQHLLLSDHSGDLLQSRSSCYLDFPDPLEFQDDGYTNVHLHIYEGLIQFAVIGGTAFVCFTLRHFELVRSLIPVDQPLQIVSTLLFLNFSWRVMKLLCTDFQHIYRFKDLNWRTTRSLITLGVMLASPSLFYPPFRLIYDYFDSDHLPSWLTQNVAYIQMMVFSFQFGTFDGLSFHEARSLDRARQSNSTTSNTKWDLVKESAAAAVSRTLVRDPSLLYMLVAAIAVALYRLATVMVRSINRPVSRILKVYFVVENGAVRHRDSFIAFLLKLLCIAWQPLKTSTFMRRASASLRGLNIMVEMLTLVVSSAVRLTGILVIRYPLEGLHLVLSSCFWVYNSLVTARDLSRTPKIRLLEVEPSVLGAEQVRCRLSWYSLDNPPRYTAISYVWGSSERASTILLNGREYKTTASAEHALMKLRSRWRSRRFWIDAICIDQSSVKDKAEQISKMAEIYRRAHEVTVWLGDDKDARFAIALARRLLAGTRPLWFSSGALNHTDRAPDRAWQALQRLLRNPWFERSWVIQEVLHNNVIVQYGDFTILWWEYSMFAMAIGSEDGVFTKLDNIGGKSHDTNTGSLTARTSRECISYIRVFQDFQSINKHQANHSHLSLLFYLIRMFRSDCKFRATETKDRVYSLVNLCGLASHPHFRPDFKLTESDTPTPGELFVLVARHHLSSSPSKRQLDFLCHAGIGGTDHAGTNLSVPSWVPDWSIEEYPCLPLLGQDGTSELLRHPMMKGILQSVADLRMFGIVRGRRMHHETPQREKVLSELERLVRQVRREAFYCATGTTVPRFKLLDDPVNTLELEGKYLDNIETLGPKFPRVSIDAGSSWSTWQSKLRPLAIVMIQWIFLPRSSPGSKIPYRVLIGDLSYPDCDFAMLTTNPPTRPASPDKVTEVHQYVRLLCSLHLNRNSPDWSLESFFDKETYLPHLYPTKELRIKGMLAIHNHVQKVCAGRRFGLTERGFEGLFPQGTRTRADSQAISRTDVNPSAVDHSGGHAHRDAEGDQVCLLFGADTPFVLRKISDSSQAGQQQTGSESHDGDSDNHSDSDCNHDYYQLVGPAYLERFMDGEGLKDAFPTTTFRIR